MPSYLDCRRQSWRREDDPILHRCIFSTLALCVSLKKGPIKKTCFILLSAVFIYSSLSIMYFTRDEGHFCNYFVVPLWSVCQRPFVRTRVLPAVGEYFWLISSLTMTMVWRIGSTQVGVVGADLICYLWGRTSLGACEERSCASSVLNR